MYKDLHKQNWKPQKIDKKWLKSRMPKLAQKEIRKLTIPIAIKKLKR